MTYKRESNIRRRWVAFFLPLIIVFIAGCAANRMESPSGPGDTQATAESAEDNLGKPVVTVLMDLPIQVDYVPDEFTKSMSGLPGYNEDFMVSLESLPPSGAERDTALSRLRTELLAGKGPDLFLCAQRLYGISAGPDDKPFFQFPVQAMSNRMFLPLDDFITQAEFIDWDGLQAVVMAAGRNEEGQQIIPLTYTFEATFFDKKDYTPERDFPMTWEEMLKDPDPEIRYAASQGGAHLQDVIGELADYSEDAPAFLEEDLRTWAGMWFDAWQGLPEEMRDEKRPETIPLTQDGLKYSGVDLGGEQEYTIIPAYNRNGGITANITTFVAINRNARRPDEAFKIIDYLLKPQVQLTSPLFQNRMEGMPVSVDAGDVTIPRSNYWWMSPANFQAISTVREQINIAKFPGPLDVSIWMMDAYDPKVLEKSAHEQYILMEMLLAES